MDILNKLLILTILVTSTRSEINSSVKKFILSNNDTAGYPYFLGKNSPKLVANPVGSTVKLTCKAGGNPEPNVTWYKDGYTPPTRSIGIIRQRKWSLEMEDSTTADQGIYTCVVCNTYGCIQDTFKVYIMERVLHRPIFTSVPHNQTLALGSTANFTCEVIQDIHAHIGWFVGTHCSNPEQLVNQSQYLNNTITSTPPEIYSINNVTHADEGWYTCVAANSLGVSCTSAYLTVTDDKI